MTYQETITWTVSPHAKQRAWERYEVMFSPQKWTDFCNTMRRERHLIRLGNDGSGSCRFACYFQKRWFLVGCCLKGNTGVVLTFLPADALTDADKSILYSDDRYGRAHNDVWNVVPQRASAGKRKSLPEIPLAQEELPQDFDQANELLEKSGKQRARRHKS